MNNRRRIYEVLIDTLALLEKTKHIRPIIYGSLGVELALGKDYDAHDIDLIIADADLDERSFSDIFANHGYEIIDRGYFTVRKEGIDIEISRLSYWEDVAKFVEINPIKVTRGDATLKVLDVQNLLRLYEYLLNEPTRRGYKNSRDELKVKHLREKMIEISSLEIEG